MPRYAAMLPPLILPMLMRGADAADAICHLRRCALRAFIIEALMLMLLMMLMLMARAYFDTRAEMLLMLLMRRRCRC